MKVDFKSRAELPFGSGDNAFTLSVRPPHASERWALVDAMDQGYLQLQAVAHRLIVGWSGIEHAPPAAGPIPINGIDEDGKESNLVDRVIGAMPLAEQFQVLAGILTFCGFRKHAELVRSRLLPVAGVEAGPLDPTKTPAGNADTQS